MKSQRSLAREFGISVSSINSNLKQKDAITKLYESNCYELRKKVTVKSGANDALNKAMDLFWNTCRIRRIPLTGPILKEQAKTYATELCINDFKASNGWLFCFKVSKILHSKQLTESLIMRAIVFVKNESTNWVNCVKVMICKIFLIVTSRACCSESFLKIKSFLKESYFI